VQRRLRPAVCSIRTGRSVKESCPHGSASCVVAVAMPQVAEGASLAIDPAQTWQI
jgi:hypothetical protein